MNDTSAPYGGRYRDWGNNGTGSFYMPCQNCGFKYTHHGQSCHCGKRTDMIVMDDIQEYDPAYYLDEVGHRQKRLV